MAHLVKKKCEECDEWKFTEQETIDTEWVPTGCETHTLGELMIDEENGTA